MAYYFAVETKENNYTAISIKRCKRNLRTTFRYESPYKYTLEEIDEITSTYTDESELKQALTKVYELTPENIDKPLTIFYAKGMEKRLIKGKILYEDSRTLTEDTSEVIKYIEEKVNDSDFTFFRQLAETLRSDSISKSLVSQLATLIEQKLITEDTKTLEKINKTINDSVSTTAKILIYNNHIDEKGVIRPTNKIDYESLHNIVSFISDYEIAINKDKKTEYSKIKKINNS